MSEGQHNSLAANASLGAGDSLWQACIDQLAQELPEQQFNTWIKPLVAQVSDDFSRVTLFVANRFKLDWVRAQYTGRIAATLEKLYGQPVQLELALAPRESGARTYSSPAVDRCWRGRRAGRDQRGQRRRHLQEPPEYGPDLRHPGGGHGQPHGAGRRHACLGHARPSLQPAVHLWRGRPGQDPPGPRGGQQAAGRQTRQQSSLHPRGAVRLGCG